MGARACDTLGQCLAIIQAQVTVVGVGVLSRSPVAVAEARPDAAERKGERRGLGRASRRQGLGHLIPGG